MVSLASCTKLDPIKLELSATLRHESDVDLFPSLPRFQRHVVGCIRGELLTNHCLTITSCPDATATNS